MDNELAVRLETLEKEHAKLRKDYDDHLLVGKYGSMAAMTVFLIIFSFLVF